MVTDPQILEALARTDFNSVKQVQNIWTLAHDIPTIHQDLRRRFDRHLETLRRSKNLESQRGLIFIGNPGAGKTHLLSAFCRQTMDKGGFFIMVDMNGVTSFYDTVVENLINSLLAADHGGQRQLSRLAENIFLAASYNNGQLPPNFDEWLANAPKASLIQKTTEIINRLNIITKSQPYISRFQDTLRAVFFLHSNDLSLATYGRLWLQGSLDLNDPTIKPLAFSSPRPSPEAVIQAMTWLMSLNEAFSVLALDQLDTIITLQIVHLNGQNDGNTPEFLLAKKIINGVTSGLGTLINNSYRSTVALSLLQDSLAILTTYGMSASMQRYKNSLTLAPIEAQDMVALVAERLAQGFKEVDFQPPYPSWPFPPAIFEPVSGILYPRQILSRCQDYLDVCLDQDEIKECPGLMAPTRPTPGPKLPSPLPNHLTEIEARFQNYYHSVNPADYQTEEAEETLWPDALESVALCFCQEETISQDEALVVADNNYSTKKYPLIHVIIKHEFDQSKNQEKDRSLYLRVILKNNATAFMARLNSAVNHCGLNQALSFRKLAIIRFSPYPTGKKTEETIKNFEEEGGLLLKPGPEDLRRIGALAILKKEDDPFLRRWLKETQPTRKIDCLRDLFQWLVK
jgi:hypothetical protein